MNIRPNHLRLSETPTESRRPTWIQLKDQGIGVSEAAKIMGCNVGTAIRMLANADSVLGSDRMQGSLRVSAKICGAKVGRVKVCNAKASDGATKLYLQRHTEVRLHRGVGVLAQPLTDEQIKRLPAELTILSDRNMLDRPTDEDRIASDAGDPDWFSIPSRLIAALAKDGGLDALNVTVSDKRDEQDKAV